MRYKIFQIAPDLYVSEFPRADCVDATLHTIGVTHVVQVCTKDTPPEALRDRTHYKLPLKDGDAEGQVEKLRFVVQHVLNKLQEGNTVLVHCIEGRNRSMLVAILAERVRQGWSGEQAYAYSQKVRPRCLYNPSFAPWLRTLP